MPTKTTNPIADISFEDAQLIALVTRSLKQSIESVYRDGVDQILTVSLDKEDSFVGKFRDSKQIYDFTITSGGKISYVEMEGRSDSYLIGFYLDSEFGDTGTSAAYREGFLWQQVLRGDRTSKTKQCQKGKPCGASCIARGVMCNQNLKAPQQQELQQARKTIKKKPNILRALGRPQVIATIASIAAGILLVGASIHGMHEQAKENAAYEKQYQEQRQKQQEYWDNFKQRYQQEYSQRTKNQGPGDYDPFDIKDEDIKEEYREAWKRAKQTWENAGKGRSQSQSQGNQGSQSGEAGRAESQTPLGDKNWWDVLGVDKNANADDIRKKFRRLAKQSHPDLTQDPVEKKKRDRQMQILNAAYEAAQKNFPRKDSAFWEI